MDSRCTDELIFFVNGRKVQERRPRPRQTLLSYLRDKLNLKGTKLSCGEGGCGACTVMISRVDPVTDKIRHSCVYACLVPICSIHGMAVTTIEGIGSVRDRLHPVQDCLVRNHGIQCGVCTPGMVMTMYTLLRNNPEPTKEEILMSLEGVICRCTGYAPILKGFNSFSKDQNSGCCSQLGKGKCCMSTQYRDVTELENGGSECPQLSQVDELNDDEVKMIGKETTSERRNETQELIFPPELLVNQSYNKKMVTFADDNITWFRPTTLETLLELRQKHHDATIVAGYNDIGLDVLLNHTTHSIMISLSQVRELNEISNDDNSVTFGSAVTLSRMIEYLNELVGHLPDEETRLFRGVLEMLTSIGGVHTRNTATLGGHIVSAAESDVVPLLIVAGCDVTIFGRNGESKMKMKDFISHSKDPGLNSDEILTYITLPKSSKGEHFFGYRTYVPHRRASRDDVINAGMMVNFHVGTNVVQEFVVCFGGITKTAVIIESVTSLAKDRTWDDSLFQDLLSLVKTEVETSTYKQTMMKSFLLKFFSAVDEDREMKTKTVNMRDRPIFVETDTCAQLQASPFGGVGDPLQHVSSQQLATGEAVFLDDIPPRSDELALCLVTSKKAHAKIKSIIADDALALEGVLCLVDANDVPKINIMSRRFPDEEIFASNEVNCVGQAIAAIVAETNEIACQAARLVKIEYEELEAIFTIEEAIERESYLKPLHELNHGPSLEAAFALSDHITEGEVRLGGQEHFYMETHRCIAIPDLGEQSMEIISSTQNQTHLQMAISDALGYPANKVKCKIARIGGGFGGKESRSVVVAAPCAVAAHKTRRPVRCVLDRDTDMKISGSRHPVLGRYKVGFSKSGHLMALDVDIFYNAGHSADLSHDIVTYGMLDATNVYNVPSARVRGYACKTNLPSNTAMRGFGRPQSMMICENIIGKVAITCGLSENEVREANFLPENVLTIFGQTLESQKINECWETCKANSDFAKRLHEVEEFNRKNKWRKRGIAMVPTKLGIGFGCKSMGQASALVNVYTDGSVLLTHGGIEMGQGLHTKMIQIASTVLDIPVDRIHISDTCTATIPNAVPTAASCGTDLNGMAVKNACEEIRRRLEPFKKSDPKGTWKNWVKSAFSNLVSLSAAGYYGDNEIHFNMRTKKGNPYKYYTYGAGCSEVEIDCLTGEHQVIRTDIVMDLGRSINPAIDTGQIHGAFLQGYGLFMMEELQWSERGELLTCGPGMYNLPRVHDIPRQFHVHLLENSENPKAVFSSKGVGEPPLFLAASVFFAVKEAIRSARSDSGLEDTDFKLDCPATARKIRLMCGNDFTLDEARIRSCKNKLTT